MEEAARLALAASSSERVSSRWPSLEQLKTRVSLL
jgi:hypothetical protein